MLYVFRVLFTLHHVRIEASTSWLKSQALNYCSLMLCRSIKMGSGIFRKFVLFNLSVPRLTCVLNWVLHCFKTRISHFLKVRCFKLFCLYKAKVRYFFCQFISFLIATSITTAFSIRIFHHDRFSKIQFIWVLLNRFPFSSRNLFLRFTLGWN